MAIPAPGRFDAEKIRAARKELGMTQVDLAERIGVVPTVVNDWEKHRARPSVRVLARLASAVGLAVAEFYQPDSDTIGTLAELRVAAGLSQRELATQLGLSQTTVSRWERALARPTWDEISSYAEVLNTSRITIGTAIDLTAHQRGDPPKQRRAVRPSAFTLTASSPHVIYDFADNGGCVDLSSPQFPLLTFRTTFTNPRMRELAVINEYFKADYFHRYNHLQRRCQGPRSDDAVYLIRWLPAFHEASAPETHSRGITAAMLVGQVEAEGFLAVESRTLPTGEHLIIVVQPQDTVEFLFGQIARGVPVTFYPTRYPDHRDDGIGPLEILWEDGSDSPTGWEGAFPHRNMPAGMTFAELSRHLRSVNPPSWTAFETTSVVPQTDVVSSIHRTFSKSTPRRQASARPAVASHR